MASIDTNSLEGRRGWIDHKCILLSLMQVVISSKVFTLCFLDDEILFKTT